MADWSLPTLSDTWANLIAFLKNRDVDLAKGMDPTNGKTNVTNPQTDFIRWNSGNGFWEIFNGSVWGPLTPTYNISISGTAGSVAFANITGKPTTLGGYGITDAQPLDADLTAIAGFTGTGFAIRTPVTWVQRALTQPAAGLTISNNNGVSGNPTFALANDLAALEGLSGNGIAVRVGTDSWNVRQILGTTNFITVTAGDGINGNPTINVGAQVAKLNTEDQTLTGGVIVTSKNLGIISSGTVTPDPGDRPQQHYTNNGAHTLAPSTNHGSLLLDITNSATAGVITTSGFTMVAGDDFTTTDTHKFRCHISIGPAGSLLHVQAMQSA